MESIKISIIIPVYNVEKYLSECLDSCINQTMREIEIICVDDCSTDSSGKILQNYARMDSRVKVIMHETNKKQGAARNTGLKYATGEYVWFIDSDDYIALEACQLLYDTATKKSVDMVCFNGINVVMDSGSTKKLAYSEYYTDWPKNRILNPAENYESLCGYFSVSPCHYITRRTFLAQFSFREGCYYEDTDFTLILFASAKSVFCIAYTAYYRRITPGSTMQSPMTAQKKNDRQKVSVALRSYIEKNNIQKDHFLYRFYKNNSTLKQKAFSEQSIFFEKMCNMLQKWGRLGRFILKLASKNPPPRQKNRYEPQRSNKCFHPRPIGGAASANSNFYALGAKR